MVSIESRKVTARIGPLPDGPCAFVYLVQRNLRTCLIPPPHPDGSALDFPSENR